MSDRLWTPYAIGLVLYHHVSVGQYPGWQAPAYQPETTRLVDMKLLERNGIEGGAPVFRTTALGAAFVGSLLSTPLPRAVFIDPRDGKEITTD